MIRKVIAYKDNFVNFYKSQDTKVQEKIEYVLDLVRFEGKFRRNSTNYLKILMGFGR
jgi:hypothetical protein